MFAPGEAGDLSKTASLSLQELLSDRGYGLGQVIDVQEASLGANQWKNSLQRLSWPASSDQDMAFSSIQGPAFNITLRPFQIKTFIISLA